MSVEMRGTDAAAPAAMFRVTLTLARGPEHPDGGLGRG